MTDNMKTTIDSTGIERRRGTAANVTKPTIGEIRTYADLPVTITHSQPAPRMAVEETCRTCKWWEGEGDDPHGKNWRDCQAVYRSKSGMNVWSIIHSDDPATSVDTVDCDAGLSTRADFSCAAWQRRADGGE